jgi:hypothetical protein
MSNEPLSEIALALDERNLAHVLSAATFAALTARTEDARPFESTCWWREQEFVLKTALNETALFDIAYRFVSGMRWVAGMGAAEQGAFLFGNEVGSNPFISLADDGQTKSPWKTFSGQLYPEKLLSEQQSRIEGPDTKKPWLTQMSRGVSSWGFDCRVGSHAYDLGFSSDKEESGARDPIYTAIEILSIAATAFFSPVQGWQLDENALGYSIWTQPISVLLAPYACTGRLDGLSARRYRVTSRGGAYGKGGAYRFFPEATLRNRKGKRQ